MGCVETNGSGGEGGPSEYQSSLLAIISVDQRSGRSGRSGLTRYCLFLYLVKPLLPNSPPFCRPALTQALDIPKVSLLLEDMTDHVDARCWTNLRNLGDGEISNKPVDRLDNVLGLGSSGGR